MRVKVDLYLHLFSTNVIFLITALEEICVSELKKDIRKIYNA